MERYKEIANDDLKGYDIDSITIQEARETQLMLQDVMKEADMAPINVRLASPFFKGDIEEELCKILKK